MPRTTTKKPATTRAKRTTKRATKRAPSVEDIQRRAYEIFVSRGGDHGNDMADWLAAEQELSE